MRYTRRIFLPCILVLLAASCATASQSGENTGGSRDRLNHEQLVNTAELNLYDAILRLRPMWLRTRATSPAHGPDPVIVYMDNVRYGEAPLLRDIMVEDVQEVSYINAADATTRWGVGVAGGVILVVSKSG